MNKGIYVCFAVFVFQFLSVPGNCLAPIVAGAAAMAGLSGLGTYFYTSIRCRFATCCNDQWIPGNIEDHRLYGQPFVSSTVVRYIRGHVRSSDPSSALALAFHGPTGVGKSHVSRIIAENLYTEGLNSPYVHVIPGITFAHSGKDYLFRYQDQLKSWIEGNVTHCERSLFILDDVDLMPGSLLDIIMPYLDYHKNLGGINYRKTIFIFLSNVANDDIMAYTYRSLKEGKGRADLKLKEIEDVLMKSINNIKGGRGLYHSQLIKSSLIKAYIPFLPLEKEHVRKCIRDTICAKGYYTQKSNIPDDVVEKVIQELSFDPEYKELFSQNGYKRTEQKVDELLGQ